MALWTSNWLQDLKTWMKEHKHGVEMDDRAEQLIDAIVSLVQRDYLATEFLKKTRTEQPHFRRGDRALSLMAWPVSEVESVKFDPERGFGSDIDAVDPGNYYLDGDAGQIVFDDRLECEKPGSIQVVYKGGMASSFADLKSRYPEIVQAVLMWCGDWFDRGSRISAREKTVVDGVVTVGLDSKPPKAALALLSHGRVRLRAN